MLNFLRRTFVDSVNKMSAIPLILFFGDDLDPSGRYFSILLGKSENLVLTDRFLLSGRYLLFKTI